MSRTALDLTHDEWRAYRTRWPWDERAAAARWTRAWSRTRLVAQAMRERFGATKVVVSGSLVNRDRFSPFSDIDLAVRGIPAVLYYRAVAAALDTAADVEIDVVDADSCGPALREVIEREGIEV